MSTMFTRLAPEQFTDAAQLDPTAVAVGAGDRELTFAEVDSWSDRVADALIALGAGADAFVVMAMSPSIESFVAVWAVAKTGASLTSVDPSDLYAPTGRVLSDKRITVGVTSIDGSRSVSTTPAARSGPAFVKVRVKATTLPGESGSGASTDWPTETSTTSKEFRRKAGSPKR